MAGKAVWKRQGRATLDCAHCEDTVTRQREEQRFCSDRCRIAHHRAREAGPMIQLSYAEWLAQLNEEAPAGLMTRDQFRARLNAQVSRLPTWG